MKRIIVKISIVLLLVLTMAGRKDTEVSAKIKTKKITIDLRGGNTAASEPEMVRKAKKVKVKSSKKSVVTVKFKKKRKQIYFKAEKKGTVVVYVSCKMKNGKTKKMKYKVKVIKTKAPTDLERSKKAFAIQNQYRKAKGIKELQWSDEIYQKLITVDADETPKTNVPSVLTDVTYYRQRITVKKKDEDGNGLGGIQFTLDADNLDDLYSFSVSDRDGVESSSADDDNETSFSLTGYTRDSGRLAYRMTYRLQTMDYYYYTDSELADMDSDEKKAAKKFLTDDLELDEGIDFPSDLTKASAQKMAAQEIKDLMDNISNTYTLTENNTGENKNLIVDPTYAKGVKITCHGMQIEPFDLFQTSEEILVLEKDEEIQAILEARSLPEEYREIMLEYLHSLKRIAERSK